MAEPTADIDHDEPTELKLDNLFSVSRVEVVQQVSSEELKVVIQQLARSLAALSQGPKSIDLHQSILGLRAELTELKSTHSSSLKELATQQVCQWTILASFCKGLTDMVPRIAITIISNHT